MNTLEQIPSLLLQRLQKIYSKEEINSLWQTFSLKKRPVSFRVNFIKSSIQSVEKSLINHDIIFTKLDFPEGSYILDEKHKESDLWGLDIYKNGEIYLQWLSSQIPPHLFSSKKATKILDACAAPWWKTSILSEKYPDAEIYAFEPSKIRYEKMKHNLNKLWCKNVIPINDSVWNIANHISKEEYFDFILIDAPCSSEWWLSIHNTKFMENWSLNHIKKNYKRQKMICDSTIPYLKEWGELIYSTCTIAPEENEWICHFILCKYSNFVVKNIDIDNNLFIKTLYTLKNFEKFTFKNEISKYAKRIMPSKHSEWFFIIKFVKWLNP